MDGGPERFRPAGTEPKAMHRAQVERWTRRAQVGGAALLIGAAGLAAAPGSWAGPAAAPEAPAATGPVVKAPTGPKVEVADAFELGSNWALVSPEMPKDDPPAPPVAEGGPDATAEPAPPPPPPWRFVGSMAGPRWTRAIIAIEDRQKLVSPGEAIDEHATLVAVEADHVVVREHDQERRENLAPRQSQPEGVQSSTAVVPGGPGAAMPTPALNPDGSPVTSNPAARALERAARGGRGAQPVNGRPGGTGPGARWTPPGVGGTHGGLARPVSPGGAGNEHAPAGGAERQ